ncbi:MAG TPA: IPExxxVDY family protein [Bacteroidales bacterium]
MGKKDVHKLSPETGIAPILLGISSHENDYRLSWALNENLGFRFTKTENHKSFNQRLSETQEFSTYSFTDDENSNTYRLISNRCDNGFLLDELKNIDFLVLIEPSDPLYRASELMAKIRSVPFVSGIFAIDMERLKNKKRLL